MSEQNPQVEQVLHQTEVGNILLEYKNLWISLGLVLVLGFAGWGIFHSYSEKKVEKAQAMVYEFTQAQTKAFNDKQIDAATFALKVNELVENSGAPLEIFPFALSSVDSLLSKGNSVEALSILEVMKKKFLAKNAYTEYFILARMAVAYEDTNKNQEAVEALEKLNQSSLKILEAKNYLDLGRLYLKLGNKEKAKVSFEYVIDKLSSNDYSRVARIYLAELGTTK